ncbi:MAG: hypothetical protein BMS9Abin18_0075 [Zetaproteobacteria bacterium]|nr:MAG: hypothetical protein BMS9Abin18_0075 [Zetaproteobacteria bacterium]
MLFQQKSKIPIPPIALVLVTLPVFIINIYQNVFKHH